MLGIVKVNSSGVYPIGIAVLGYKYRPSDYSSTVDADLFLILGVLS